MTKKNARNDGSSARNDGRGAMMIFLLIDYYLERMFNDYFTM